MKNSIVAQYAGVVAADLSTWMVQDSAHPLASGRVAPAAASTAVVGTAAFAGTAAAAKSAIPATRLRRAYSASVIDRYREHSR
ncbi:hypothetical protein DK926_18070 [Rhodococcus sp. Eu-32]|uniref:hypothetical protein n=1 Tax=Rhodococcus sp. Eu-32 TaxID=1017319 RepID=UPI000DF3EA56|nr:hypothetical protein [Rhodococcus sp. Eu-32]RRQ26428.1 hypothetical protein DK926_18070 [Rhodococcus sp. Eu-32]